MNRKKLVVMVAGLVIVVITIVIGVYYYFIKETGVMEQIYKAAKTGGIKMFNQVEALEGITDDDLAQFENFGGLSISYKEEYLEDNVKVKLFFSTDKDNIIIKSVKYLAEDTVLIIHITYDYKSRTLTNEPISISYTEDRDGNTEY